MENKNFDHSFRVLKINSATSCRGFVRNTLFINNSLLFTYFIITLLITFMAVNQVWKDSYEYVLHTFIENVPFPNLNIDFVFSNNTLLHN